VNVYKYQSSHAHIPGAIENGVYMVGVEGVTLSLSFSFCFSLSFRPNPRIGLVRLSFLVVRLVSCPALLVVLELVFAPAKEPRPNSAFVRCVCRVMSVAVVVLARVTVPEPSEVFG
jgi:hypothetical protein